MSEVEYQDRTVAFLDILGFRQLIAANKVGLILKALNESADVLEKTADKPKMISLQTAQFSDSIIISGVNPGRDSPGAAVTNTYVLDFARQIALRLLHAGVLCRGGVALGKMYHDERHGFGPALVRAYEIESECAIYPRIVVDASVLQGWGKMLGNSLQFIKGNDGLSFINIFKREAMAASFGDDVHGTMAHFGNKLKSMRGEASEDRKACAKIDWAITNHQWATELIDKQLSGAGEGNG